MEYRCIKCGSEKYIVKTVFLPEKEPGIKLEVGKYYFKTCIHCGFTEVYNAKIVEDNKQLTPEFL